MCFNYLWLGFLIYIQLKIVQFSEMFPVTDIFKLGLVKYVAFLDSSVLGDSLRIFASLNEIILIAFLSLKAFKGHTKTVTKTSKKRSVMSKSWPSG